MKNNRQKKHVKGSTRSSDEGTEACGNCIKLSQNSCEAINGEENSTEHYCKSCYESDTPTSHYVKM